MRKSWRIAPMALAGALLVTPAFAQGQQQQSPDQQSQKSQQQSSSQQSSSQSGQQGAQLHVGPEGVRQIQQALNQRGFDVGNPDGSWNQQTKDAVKQFQESQGMQSTGNLNLATISALGVNVGQQGQQRPQQAQGPESQQSQQAQPD